MYMAGREIKGKRGGLAAPHDNISPFNPIFQLTGQPTFPDTVTNISRFPMKGIVSLAFTGGALVSNAADIAEWGNALFGGRATSKVGFGADAAIHFAGCRMSSATDWVTALNYTTRFSSTEMYSMGITAVRRAIARL